VIRKPELAQDHEAQCIGAQRRQQLVECAGEVGPVQARPHLEVEGEQRDRDGEDGVGEGQDAVGLDRPAPQRTLLLPSSLPQLLAPCPFAETGYDGTSVRELSRRLGVSHALLTARFGSKEGLWFAAMEHALAHAEQTWRKVTDSPGLDDLQALRQGVVRQVIFSAAHPQVLRIMSHEGAIDSPRVRFVVDRFVNPLRPGVERLLARLVAAGRIRRASSP
jgi:hypothetical protein